MPPSRRRFEMIEYHRDKTSSSSIATVGYLSAGTFDFTLIRLEFPGGLTVRLVQLHRHLHVTLTICR
jgi:hypothetical protein